MNSTNLDSQRNGSSPSSPNPRKWNVKRWMIVLVLAMAVALGAIYAFSGKSREWWNGGWSMRKQITLDTAGAGITDAIGTTPVLIRLHDGNFHFDQAQDDGSDLRFVAGDDKTPLKFHIEKYDALLAEALVWVQVPDLAANAKTPIWMYYGNPAGASAPDAASPKGTYDGDTALIYHFADASGQPPTDSTGNGNAAQNPATTEEGEQIGAGLKLDTSKTILLPDSPSLTWTAGGSLTWSAWIKFPAVQPNAVIFSRTAGTDSFVIGVDNGIPYLEVDGQRSGVGTPIPVATWSHLAVVAGSGKITLYLNGAPYATVAAPLPAMTGSAQIGGGFVGQLDELEISKVARSSGFIKLAAVGQSEEGEAKLLTIGDDLQGGTSAGGGASFYVVILRSVTVDGWVIIISLIIMGVVSWWVMVRKWDYLKRNKLGNTLFLKEWQKVASDLTQLDHGDEEKIKTLGGRLTSGTEQLIRESSLYRIYHIGAAEIRHRMKSDGPNELSPLSIQAIRAAMDGGLVREGERLNDQMVILTISISGGPFVGLLGTVAGVMITFAAIAAAGEVNVNSIAPGISAALVATVAGLLVAIPALFGYNLLTTRIEAAVNDMQVFNDEYVSKMAEFYQGRPAVRANDDNHPADGLLLDALVLRLANATRIGAHN